MKCERVTLKFSNLGDNLTCNIVIYSDAFLGNLRDGGSQGGFLVFLKGENKKFACLLAVKLSEKNNKKYSCS